MFNDLVALFSGWYADYVEAIRDLLQTSQVIVTLTPDGQGDYVTQTIANELNPEIWSAYVPWEHIIAAAVLIVFTACIFRFMRTVLCKIL